MSPRVVKAVGAAAARFPRVTRPYSASRILDTTQIRRSDRVFSSSVNVTIQHFHGAPQLITGTKEATNHASKHKCQKLGLTGSRLAMGTAGHITNRLCRVKSSAGQDELFKQAGPLPTFPFQGSRYSLCLLSFRTVVLGS